MAFGGFVRIKVASGPPAPVVNGIQLARDAAVLIGARECLFFCFLC